MVERPSTSACSASRSRPCFVSVVEELAHRDEDLVGVTRNVRGRWRYRRPRRSTVPVRLPGWRGPVPRRPPRHGASPHEPRASLPGQSLGLLGRLRRRLLGCLCRLLGELARPRERLVRSGDRARCLLLAVLGPLLRLLRPVRGLRFGPFHDLARRRLLGEALAVHPMLGLRPRAADALGHLALHLGEPRVGFLLGLSDPDAHAVLGVLAGALDVPVAVVGDLGGLLGVVLRALRQPYGLGLCDSCLLGGGIGLVHQVGDLIPVDARHRVGDGASGVGGASSDLACRRTGALGAGRRCVGHVLERSAMLRLPLDGVPWQEAMRRWRGAPSVRCWQRGRCGGARWSSP